MNVRDIMGRPKQRGSLGGVGGVGAETKQSVFLCQTNFFMLYNPMLDPISENRELVNYIKGNMTLYTQHFCGGLGPLGGGGDRGFECLGSIACPPGWQVLRGD